MTIQYEANLSLPDKLLNYEERIKVLEERFSELGFSMQGIVTSEVKRRWRIMPQSMSMYGMMTALCVATIDPWKQNRVQFYSPLLHDSDTAVSDLPFAWPISSMGGFDDCGLNWVPPAGSMLCLLFETGARWAPFYLGTTWTRDRGPIGGRNFGFPMPEFDSIYSGHRGGYLLEPNDESQVLPQWNTEGSNGNDINNIGQYQDNPDNQKTITTPNIYGFKTPEKHMVKLVDGDPKCDRRWKRIEILSGAGMGWMIFKDDHMRPSGQWAHPDCCGDGGDVSDCSINPDSDCDKPNSKPVCANPYFKHQNECRPYTGPQTPQNNKADLNQSGIQFLSGSGQSFKMDDSVEEPRGKPTWERSTQAFDFGCTDKFQGMIEFKSATGHTDGMYDDESDTGLRSDKNGIKSLTAAGNMLFLCDHTVAGTSSDGTTGSQLAGQQRGIFMQSTSDHIFQMCDWENDQASPKRAEGGEPVNKAKKAYILVRSGYGLQLLMGDRSSQQNTDTQFINLLSPMKDNTTRGPHMLHMQEIKEGPGIVYLRAGGNLVIQTYDNMLDIVGDPTNNPSNKISIVTNKYIINTTDVHFHYSGKQHIFFAEDKIFLLAGRDCDQTITEPDGQQIVKKKTVPCCYNVVINRNPCPCPLVTWMQHFTPGRSTSERVFASGFSPEDSADKGICLSGPLSVFGVGTQVGAT